MAFRAHLLLRIADHDPHAARDVMYLPPAAGSQAGIRFAERRRARDLGEEVGLFGSVCIKSAIERLWHACGVLQIDPTTLDVDHIG